jgi:hypothetical protein
MQVRTKTTRRLTQIQRRSELFQQLRPKRAAKTPTEAVRIQQGLPTSCRSSNSSPKVAQEDHTLWKERQMMQEEQVMLPMRKFLALKGDWTRTLAMLIGCFHRCQLL